MNKQQWHDTLEQKYGDKNYGLFGSESYKEKLIKKYGVEHITQNKEIKEKIKQTNLKKYGVECNLQLISGVEHSKQIWDEQGDKIREKIKTTSLSKYGTESPNQSDIVKQKQKEGLLKHWNTIEDAYKHKLEIGKQTKLLKHGDANYHNKEQMSRTLKNKHLEFEQKNNCTRYTEVIKQYGQGWLCLCLPVIYNGRFRYISNKYINKIKEYTIKQNNMKAVSKQETELYSFIKTCIGSNYRIYRNNRNIIKDDKQKYELDIYIPKLKIAFEYNGSYWHSNLCKNKYYHQTKTKLCYEKGIQLIHIYEFDWIKHKDKLKSQIKELLNGNDCTKYGWIPVKEYSNYILTEPQVCFETKDRNLVIYDEGKFIKKSF